MSFTVIGSGGSERLSSVFNSSGQFLIPFSRLWWRRPKIVFQVNRYIVPSLLVCVALNTNYRTYENVVFQQQGGDHSYVFAML